ncbi:MAG: GspE/PulE family protein [Gammaproteobacteria bacterium]|nr:GspE/PulE family protein [Gammaproteobacteria bacterium]
MALSHKKIRLGDLLVENGEITGEQLQLALQEQKRGGRKLGATLIDLGYVSEDRLLDILAKQLQIPLIDLAHYEYDVEVLRRLPETLARRYRAILLQEKDNEVLIGMADPTDLFAFDQIARHLGKHVKQAIVREAQMLSTFDQVYRRTQEITHLAEELGQELSEDAFDVSQLTAGDDMANAPVVKLLQSLFEDAVQMNASDIHIEPDETVLRVRQRIDGVLHEQVMKERHIASAVISRLKLMANLDISEKRLPQDGRFNIKVKSHAIDVRLSTMPTQNGESVVMRLLDQTNGIKDLEQLGMPDRLLQRFRSMLRNPHGLILVTGPTGSGKTTTLYAALHELNRPQSKIITVEDPVEYRLPRVNQVQINPKIELTFASVLRTALRQDPDIVLIGEMRDYETIEIGLRSAMTGHLVLSSLHTNDAVSTADRLLDMGAEGYLIAAALRVVVSQRLVRRLCTSCKSDYEPDLQERSWLASIQQDAKPLQFQQGSGCPHCNNTGYSGRLGVYEYMEPSEAMLAALRQADAAAFAAAAKTNPAFHSLLQSAMDYARQGLTSLEEVMRIAGEMEQSDTQDWSGFSAAAVS